MTFRQIEFFTTVCKCKSISKASAVLRISQQGISKALLDLEAELGCQLLKRTSSGVTLTNYGTYVLQEFEIILRKKEYISSYVLQMKSTAREPLLVGMSFGVLSALPHNFLSDFITPHPYIELNYSDYTDITLENRLLKGECDLALIAGPVNCEGLQMEVIKAEKVYLCIPSRHPLYEAQEITLQGLAAYTFVMFSDQFYIQHHFWDSCRHAGFSPRVFLSSNDFNSLKELAFDTGNLFVVPEHTIPKKDSQFRYYPFPDPYFTWEITYATRKNKLMTEGMMAFYQSLKETVG